MPWNPPRTRTATRRRFRAAGSVRRAARRSWSKAHPYPLGSRSAIEWIIDRYWVKTDKASGIVNDLNDWSREVGDPCYIVDLMAGIVTVSLETVRVVNSLWPRLVSVAE